MQPDLDWRAVRAFLTVAAVSSYTAAARELGVTQSAVSHALKRLEGQLGCRLLIIHGKTPRLTPEGSQFYQAARRAMEQMERAAHSVSREGDERGRLRVIFSASIARILLGKVLREFRDCYPNLELVIGLEDTPGAVRALEQSESDLALGISDRLPPGLTALPLFQDQLLLAVPPIHPLVEKNTVTLRDLTDERFITYRKGSLTRNAVEQHFLQAGIRPAAMLEVPDFEVIKELVRLGLGVALMAPWVIADEMASGAIIGIPVKRPVIRRTWAVLLQQGRRLRASERTLIGLCRMAVRQMEGVRPSDTRIK